ncbi:MAG: hypothetical protein M0004_08820 [Actinomycetota bacterium]|nr:hypothetical protein [Actinomycetota bacterium]
MKLRPTVSNASRIVAIGAIALLGISGTAAAAKASKPTHKKPAATKPAAVARAAGVIKAVDAKSHTVTVMVGKATDVFHAAAAKVTVAGKSASIGALKAGEHATITYTHKGKAFDASAIVVAKA